MAFEFSALELVERLAALVPPPGKNQVLYHGVLAGNAAEVDAVGGSPLASLRGEIPGLPALRRAHAAARRRAGLRRGGRLPRSDEVTPPSAGGGRELSVGTAATEVVGMGTCAQEPAAAPDCHGSAPRRGPDEPAASPSGGGSLAVSALAWENGPAEAVHVSYPQHGFISLRMP